jgi:hypothetical protein
LAGGSSARWLSPLGSGFWWGWSRRGRRAGRAGLLAGGSSNWLLVSIILYLTLVSVVIKVFVPRGKVFEQALAEALAQGRVTPELTAAFHDQAVAWAHWYELMVVAIIIILMVTKPF